MKGMMTLTIIVADTNQDDHNSVPDKSKHVSSQPSQPSFTSKFVVSPSTVCYNKPIQFYQVCFSIIFKIFGGNLLFILCLSEYEKQVLGPLQLCES